MVPPSYVCPHRKLLQKVVCLSLSCSALVLTRQVKEPSRGSWGEVWISRKDLGEEFQKHLHVCWKERKKETPSYDCGGGAGGKCFHWEETRKDLLCTNVKFLIKTQIDLLLKIESASIWAGRHLVTKSVSAVQATCGKQCRNSTWLKSQYSKRGSFDFSRKVKSHYYNNKVKILKEKSKHFKVVYRSITKIKS